MKHTAQQYACFAGATAHDQGARFKARLSVISSWRSRIAPGSYRRPALICAQSNSANSFHETRCFDHRGGACSGLLIPLVSDAFDSSSKHSSGRYLSNTLFRRVDALALNN